MLKSSEGREIGAWKHRRGGRCERPNWNKFPNMEAEWAKVAEREEEEFYGDRSARRQKAGRTRERAHGEKGAHRGYNRAATEIHRGSKWHSRMGPVFLGYTCNTSPSLATIW
jgi:hypothetical protein